MRTRTLFALILFIGLGTAVGVHEWTDLFRPPPPEKTGSWPMFTFAESDLGAVELIYKGEIVTAMRGPDGTWFLHDGSHSHSGGENPDPNTDRHDADPELSAMIAKQLDITARMIADTRIVPEGDLSAYGLANPAAIFIFYGRADGDPDYSRPLAVMHVGSLLPTEFTYYTLLEGDLEMSLIPRYQVSLLLAMAFGPEAAPSPSPLESRTEAPG